MNQSLLYHAFGVRRGYSNCEALELYLNGKLIGTQRCQPLTHVAWKVPYQSGTLAVRAFRNGKVVCADEVKTAEAPDHIQLSADRDSIAADGCDLSFITVRVLDHGGQLVPLADNEITVEVKGRGRLLALCSGDPASHENPKANRMKAFNGLLLAIVQSNGRPGDVLLRTSSPGLAPQSLHFKAKRTLKIALK